MARSRQKMADDYWARYDVERLTLREAAHLFRRAGFATHWNDLQAATAEPLEMLVERLLAAREDAEFEQQSQAMKPVIQAGNLPVQLPAWWLYRLQRTACQALEKLVVFWHGHFATSAAKVTSAPSMLAQNETLRKLAFQPFEQMLLSISRDPAMLVYLDCATNRRNHPNENYARELFELFSLGIGNYTEADIRELARAFTGWEIVRGQFTFNSFQHDPGSKSFLGNQNIQGGEDAIAQIVAQPAAANFIAHKLFRFYVSDQPADSAAIAPLADCLQKHQFAIRPVLQKMFTSRIFYSEHAIAKKVRSPVEFAIGLLRTLNATTSPIELAQQTAALGQSLFYPPNVKGWVGGNQWINSATMVGRINLVTKILNSPQTDFVGGRDRLDHQFGVSTAAEAVDRTDMIWFAKPLPQSARDPLTAIVEKTQGQSGGKILACFKAAATMAEFQLG